MTKRKWLVLAVGLVLVLTLSAVAYARSAAGGEEDPLITLSYLEEVFLPELLEDYGGEGNSTPKGNFALVSLSDGQILRGKRGCEVVLRIGTARAHGADEPVLVDTSTGGELAHSGALTKNHLYMITIEDNGLVAVGSVKLLVSGGYTIE